MPGERYPRTSKAMMALGQVNTSIVGTPLVTYALQRLAVGNYDLILDGIVIGSVVRCSTPKSAPVAWRAELSEEWEAWPPPFLAAEHESTSLEAVTDWLGGSLSMDRPHKRD